MKSNEEFLSLRQRLSFLLAIREVQDGPSETSSSIIPGSRCFDAGLETAEELLTAFGRAFWKSRSSSPGAVAKMAWNRDGPVSLQHS